MSEEVASEIATETPENPALTPEQKVAQVKVNLNNHLAAFHNNLFNFVSTLPINEDQKKFALQNLIQALHWAEDGIEALVFEVEPLPPQGENDDATQEGFQPENHSEEHQDGNQGGEEAVTGSSDSVQDCQKEQEEVTQPKE